MQRNPLEIIQHAHLAQSELCDALERIADGLPDDVDRRLCAWAASSLKYDVPLHHRDEDQGLFPQLRRRAWPSDSMDAILDRLTHEHDSDTDLGTELAEWLDHLAEGRRLANPDMVGYMLRGFFESYRRHLHWEDTLVMPVARRRLGDDDFIVIAEVMERNRVEAS
jgi:hemerythrin-like domain-containing protein